jgi:hypothetical protein
MLGADGMAALISESAAIDWWCQPRLDDDPVLWRLLDPDGAVARWDGATPLDVDDRSVGPSLRTVVRIGDARVECWDAVLRRRELPVIARLVRALDHPCTVTHQLRAPAFRGSANPVRVRALGGTIDVAEAHHALDSAVHAVTDGWRAVLVGSAAAVEEPWTVPDLVREIEAAEALAARRTEPVSIVTSHRERVAATLGVLDACTVPGGGAVIAAPTTSLPEVRGADRQFDYRYAWLRDASLAVSVAALVGEVGVARRHLRWLVDRCVACEGIPPPLATVDDADPPVETTVPRVAGWGSSLPVRVGNAARDQLQLDGPGFVAEAVWITFATSGHRDRGAYDAVAALSDAVCDLPADHPSAGIWEQREPASVSNADVGRWLVHDRARRLSWIHEPLAWRRRRRWRAASEAARRRFLAGRLPSGAAPLVYGRPEPDGAGLLPVVLGLLPATDPAAAALVDATIAALGSGDPLVTLRRYPATVDDGFDGDEGSFVPVSWWAVSALAKVGRVADAHALADRLCASLPGLQGEVISPSGEMLGNTPLVWSHAEAARALYLLRVADLRDRFGRAGVVAWRTWQLLRAHRNGRTSRSQWSKKPS